MIRPEHYFNELIKNEIDFFSGVPDSLLKDICAYITDNTSQEKNIIAANEGSAIALAAGYYLSTSKIAMVYMQNSGLGNAINPLLSLADNKVYGIPMLLMIGWRGEPNIHDEPQHIKQGEITLELLKVLGIEYEVLSKNEDDLTKSLKRAIDHMKNNNSPYAFVIKKGTFSSYKLKSKLMNNYKLNREEALKAIISNIKDNSAIISTTGKTSRELFELRELLNQPHERDFLCVGSMGHALSIATGVALSQPGKNIYCIDGDGALIMHMGGLAISGQLAPSNLKYIVINNGAHDSVGGQPTVAFGIEMENLAKSCGFKETYSVDSSEKLLEIIKKIDDSNDSVFLEIKINKGSRKDLGRPTKTTIENKNAFMNYLIK